MRVMSSRRGSISLLQNYMPIYSVYGKLNLDLVFSPDLAFPADLMQYLFSQRAQN